MMVNCKKNDIKKFSDKLLFDTLIECGCDNYYRVEWEVVLDELESRLGLKREKVDEAITYFKHGLSHDLFSDDMVRVARTSLEALEKMREDM